MRKSLHPSAALRSLCLFSVVALSLSAGCRKKIEETPPVKVHLVTINWVPSTSRVAGYYVYRLSPSGIAVKLTNEIVYGNQYIDKAVEPGQSYTYFVTSVDFKGKESEKSAKITATVPMTFTPPAKQ